MSGMAPAPFAFEMFRRNIRTFGSALFQNIRVPTAGATQVLNSPAYRLDTGTPGGIANRSIEVGETANSGTNAADIPVDGYGETTTIISCTISPLTATNPTATQYCGFELGGFGIAPPWPTHGTNLCLMQVRIRQDNNHVEFVVDSGTNTTGIVKDLGVAPTNGIFHVVIPPQVDNNLVGIPWIMTLYAGNKVMGTISSTEVTGFPGFNEIGINTFGIFCTSGTNTSGQINCDFGNINIERINLTSI